MHVAGLRPQYLSASDVPPEVAASERALLAEQAAASGKGAAVVDKMVQGRLAKWTQEVGRGVGLRADGAGGGLRVEAWVQGAAGGEVDCSRSGGFGPPGFALLMVPARGTPPVASFNTARNLR
jgi:hypothetical protein